MPLGSHALITAAAGCRLGWAIPRSARLHEPGPSEGNARSGRYTAPAARSAFEAGSPRTSTTSANDSPREWATMNHGGTPEAHSAPIIEPAEVPTT